MYIHTYTHISYTVHISYRYTCTWHEIYKYLLHSSIIYNMSIIYIYTHINTRKFVGSECPRKATLDLASLYAFCWQSLERAERSMDSERLLCVAQMLCRWIETAPRVVDGSGELPAFRFFFWDFLENHRVYAELWRRIWNIPHNDWLGYNGIKIWIETTGVRYGSFSVENIGPWGQRFLGSLRISEGPA